MKKGIDCHPDYDENGRWCLRIKKQRGHFTLDELQEILTEYEWDYYAVIIKAIDTDGDQYFDDVPDPGDFIIAYRATDFLRRAPVADVVEVVRCKDCINHRQSGLCEGWSRYGTINTADDAFCSYGVKRDG